MKHLLTSILVLVCGNLLFATVLAKTYYCPQSITLTHCTNDATSCKIHPSISAANLPGNFIIIDAVTDGTKKSYQLPLVEVSIDKNANQSPHCFYGTSDMNYFTLGYGGSFQPWGKTAYCPGADNNSQIDTTTCPLKPTGTSR